MPVNTQWCMCGAQVSYPHTPDCPYPEYRSNDKAAAAWAREMERKMHARLAPEHAADIPAPTTDMLTVTLEVTDAAGNRYLCEEFPGEHTTFGESSIFDSAADETMWGTPAHMDNGTYAAPGLLEFWQPACIRHVRRTITVRAEKETPTDK